MKKNTFLKHVAAKNNQLGTVRYLVQKCKVIITEGIAAKKQNLKDYLELKFRILNYVPNKKTSKIKTPSAKNLSE